MFVRQHDMRPQSRQSRHWTHRIRGIGLVCILALALQAPAAQAADGAGAEAGNGAGAALCSLIYGPVKIVYSALGLVFGGMAWGLSGGNKDVMNAVITPAVRGDYVVTPSHLRGERELEFFGRDPEYRR
jgi:hypothetical protein